MVDHHDPVNLNGKPALSGLLRMGSIGVRKIITIERIGATKAGREIGRASLELQVVHPARDIVSADVATGSWLREERPARTRSVEAGRWPNERTPIVRGKRPH
jgi:hypothetical protein